VVAVTTTTVVAIVAAAVAGVALLLVVLWLFRGPKRGDASDERLTELVTDMNSRMETMVRELSEALEYAQEEGRRNQMLGELAGTIDLDEVLTRTLDAAGALPGVDAALARLENGGDTPIIATLGLTTEEAQRQAIAGPPRRRGGAFDLTRLPVPGRALERRLDGPDPLGACGADPDGERLDRLHRGLLACALARVERG